MHLNLGHCAASSTGTKQPMEEANSEPESKLNGSARPQAGQVQEGEQQQGQEQAGQGTVLPCAPSLTHTPQKASYATAFPDSLDTNVLLDFNSQEAWAEFNSLFPTEHFSPALHDQQQAGATVKNAFGLSDQPVSDPVNASDPPALPQVDTAMDSIPPRALPAAKVDDKPAAIPLICHLCPKNPTFSDVSHLLTHVSSKSHLAAEFKLKHSKKVEDQRALVQYAQWAQDHGVNDLVANRIAAKEQKKAPKRQRVVNSEHTKKKPRNNIKNDAGGNLQAQPQPVPPQSNANLWHLHTPRDNSFDDPYSTPNNKKLLSAYHFSDSPQSSVNIKQESSRSGTEVADATFPPDAPVFADGELSGSRLKGTVYPGMSIFDAASDEQRRKRNQKKLPSVLQNMVLTSESVEQYECVWDEDMSEITRTRNVYDSPSIDGSQDDKDEVPSSGKKRRGRRAVTAAAAPRRQTRATIRASSSKIGKRGAAGSKKKNMKAEIDFDSDEETSTPFRAHGHGLFGGDADDAEDADDASLEDDVFQERRQARQGTAASPIASHPFGHPTAMQALPANMPLNTSSSMFNKPGAPNYFEGFGLKENDSMVFQPQQPVAMPSYFAPLGHNMQSNGLNPLCVQRQDNFPFLYGAPSFENSKSSTPAFQPMNGADYGGLSSTASFQAEKAQHQDFDI